MPVLLDGVSEWLVVDGEPASTKACKPVDLSPLLDESDRDFEGDPMPYVDGEPVYVGYLTKLTANIDWLINGVWDPDGVVQANPANAVAENLEHYRALFRDGGDAVGRKDVELHTGGRVLTGSMKTTRWTPVRRSSSFYVVVTQVVVGAGRLIP